MVGKGGQHCNRIIEGKAMTLLNTNSVYSHPSRIWATIRTIGNGLLGLVNGWVAAIIAQRARQADLTILRSLSDRQLRDIGIYRGEIDASADAAKQRALRQATLP
jgi:uncharacterized protein YjiS (DUF1127 family)